MTTLIIDTSTEQCILALSQEGNLLEQMLIPHQNNLSKILLPSIDALLKNKGLTPKHLKEIALGVGPGSYTGTRVGASVAKMLSFGLNIPLKPFHSPCLFIPPEVEGRFVFILPTKPGPFFLLYSEVNQGALLPACTEHVDTLPPLEELPPYRISPTPLNSFSHLAPELNLPLIVASLPSFSSESAKNTTLSYLHTPIAH